MSGFFANAPTNGSRITVGNAAFDVLYVANADTGDFTGGNDVALRLIAIPEPAGLPLLLAGLTALSAMRRRRR